METRLKSLVGISNYFGKDHEFVIAGGGNTSYKDENYLWIKASGTSLKTIAEDGFVKMDRNCLTKISGKTYSSDPLIRETEIKNELYGCMAEISDKRPSVETSLHNLLNFSYVVHTHPTLVNGLMCSKNCREETLAIFGEETLVIPYTDPGYILFKFVENKINEYKKKFGSEPQIIFLENHGVFVSAETITEIKKIYREIIKKIRERVNHEIPSTNLIKTEFSQLTQLLNRDFNCIARYFQSDLISQFTKDHEAFTQVDTAFSPDNIVYCKAHYLYTIADPQRLSDDYLTFKTKYGYPPKIIALENKGIICCEENEQSLNTVYEVFLDMLKISWYSRNFGGPRFMLPEQIEFIDSWEVENYRRKIAKNN